MKKPYCLLIGDVLEQLKTIPAKSIQTCVTSPPYFGLRDYGHSGQIGLESTPTAYIAKLVEVFTEVNRTLADDGTLWLNLGDSYAANGVPGNNAGGKTGFTGGKIETLRAKRTVGAGLKAKDLMMMPHRVAIALQEWGWYVRSDIVWQKPNCMPSSVKDRPTNSHEYIFLLSKSAKYYYDADAIKEPATASTLSRPAQNVADQIGSCRGHGGMETNGNMKAVGGENGYRNSRSVWAINTKAYKGAHFAVFPDELPRRCILAGSKPGDTVLDVFAGSGTTMAVALSLSRQAVGIELNPDYAGLIEKRISAVQLKLGQGEL